MTESSPTAPNLSLADVADRLGVHYMTAYRYVRLGLLEAHQEGRSWVVTEDALAAFTASAGEPTTRGQADWDMRLVARLLAGDEAGAWSVVEAAQTAGADIPTVYMKVIVPALREVGERWHRGEIDVAAEHTASRVASRIVGRLGPKATRRGVRRGTVVVGSTAAELHSLPLAIAADIVRHAQFNVLDLGINLPADQFAKAVERTDSVVAIAIGVTNPGQEDELRATISAVREVTDKPIMVGGSGIDAASARRLGADRYTATAIDLVESLNEYVSE